MHGHPSSHVLKLIFIRRNIPLINKNIPNFCSSCCVEKSLKLPFSASETVFIQLLWKLFLLIFKDPHMLPHILGTVMRSPLLMWILSSHGFIF